MTPRSSGTVPGDTSILARRRDLALEHWDAAEDLALNENGSSSILSLYILAGVAASDAICCAKLGEYSKSPNHADAVAVLRRADPRLTTSLQRLLSHKTEANYGVERLSTTRVAEARAAASRLVEAARLL